MSAAESFTCHAFYTNVRTIKHVREDLVCECAPVEQKPGVLTVWKHGLFYEFINDGPVCWVFPLHKTLAQQCVKGLSNLWATCAVTTANNILECAILSKLHKLVCFKSPVDLLEND